MRDDFVPAQERIFIAEALLGHRRVKGLFQVQIILVLFSTSAHLRVMLRAALEWVSEPGEL